MTKIAELTWVDHPSGLTGEHAVARFPNGYGASVIRGGPFYTRGGTYEIGVLRGESLCYDSGLTEDVFGYLSEEEANKVLADIEALQESPSDEKAF